MKVTSIIAAVMGAIFRVVMAVAIVYIIYRGAGICYEYGYRIFTEPAVSAGEGRTVTVTVGSEMSVLDIGKLFESRGLVRDSKLFVLQYYLSEYREDVGPGTFELSTAMTVEEMMQAMVVPEEEEEGTETAGNRGGTGNSSGGGNPPAGGSAPEDSASEGGAPDAAAGQDTGGEG